MRAFSALRINQHNRNISQQAETDKALLAIVLPLVFTRNGEVVPDRITSIEVKPMVLDVELALGFIPREHSLSYIQNNCNVMNQVTPASHATLAPARLLLS